jgi:hypothetical protein
MVSQPREITFCIFYGMCEIQKYFWYAMEYFFFNIKLKLRIFKIYSTYILMIQSYSPYYNIDD